MKEDDSGENISNQVKNKYMAPPPHQFKQGAKHFWKIPKQGPGKFYQKIGGLISNGRGLNDFAYNLN